MSVPSSYHRVAVIALGGACADALDSLWLDSEVELTVVEGCSTRLARLKNQMGELSKYIAWREADVLQLDLPHHAYDLWLDHGHHAALADDDQRARYLAQVRRALRPGGSAIIDGQRLDR